MRSLQEARELQVKVLRGEATSDEMKAIAVEWVSALEENFLLSHKIGRQQDMLGCPVCGGFH